MALWWSWGGGAVSYERGTPVPLAVGLAGRSVIHDEFLEGAEFLVALVVPLVRRLPAAQHLRVQ